MPKPLLIEPDWPAPAAVGAVMSTRQGGISRAPFESLNLRPASSQDAPGSADDPTAVAANLQAFTQEVGARPVFLRQVHGTQVVNLDDGLSDLPPADAAVTTRPGIACTVLVADCLPVLFTDRDGRGVAAAHAGWRGLAAGVLENTVAALRKITGAQPEQLLAWLGPCIGPSAFEVGPDVLAAFGASSEQPGLRFTPSTRPDGTPRWLADLPGLARDRLQALGLTSITDSGLCTVSDASRFFSFRRDGLTGRMAASIWRRG